MSVTPASLADVTTFMDLHHLVSPDDQDSAQTDLNEALELMSLVAGSRILLPAAGVTKTLHAPFGSYLRIPDISIQAGVPAITSLTVLGAPLTLDTDYLAEPSPDGLTVWGLRRIDANGNNRAWVPDDPLIAPWRAIVLVADLGINPPPLTLIDVNLAVASEIRRDRKKLFVDAEKPFAGLGQTGGNFSRLPQKALTTLRLFWREPLDGVIAK